MTTPAMSSASIAIWLRGAARRLLLLPARSSSSHDGYQDERTATRLRMNIVLAAAPALDGRTRLPQVIVGVDSAESPEESAENAGKP